MTSEQIGLLAGLFIFLGVVALVYFFYHHNSTPEEEKFDKVDDFYDPTMGAGRAQMEARHSDHRNALLVALLAEKRAWYEKAKALALLKWEWMERVEIFKTRIETMKAIQRAAQEAGKQGRTLPFSEEIMRMLLGNGRYGENMAEIYKKEKMDAIDYEYLVKEKEMDFDMGRKVYEWQKERFNSIDVEPDLGGGDEDPNQPGAFKQDVQAD